jgi:tyrosyl-tRNA synthetase
VASKLAATKNEARRLLKQGGVKLNGKPVANPSLPRSEASGAILQVGSRRFRKLVA